MTNGEGVLGELSEDQLTAVNFRTGALRLVRPEGDEYDSTKLVLLQNLKAKVTQQGISSTVYFNSLFTKFQSV